MKREYYVQMGSVVNSTKHLRKKYSFSTNSLTEAEGMPPNSFYEANIALVLNIANARNENYKPFFFMNTDANILNKMLAN